MRSGFLDLLRGADMRSLARALAVLIVLNAVVAAFHTAQAATGASAGTILCTVDGIAGDGPPKAPADLGCCVLGCAPGAALAPEILPTGVAEFGADSRPPPVLSILPERRSPGAASPRGPPLLS